MSQAFMREGDEMSLSDVRPSISALIVFLTKGNNGVRVYEKKAFKNSTGLMIHSMSDGLSYVHDSNGKWMVVER